MNSRLPSIQNRINICIICEGMEEYKYLERLNELGVWNSKYKIELENACGNGNLPARYQNEYQNGNAALVLIFCDTERKPYEQYMEIKKKVNDFHGVEKAADAVIIYGNPCTMQIILAHWTDVILKTPAKKMNRSIVEECTGVAGYKGSAEQCEQIARKITKENYIEMLRRVKRLPDNDSITGSSNFNRFMDCFSRDDCGWIDEINRVLEEEQ